MRPRSSDPPALRAITRRRFLALAAAAAAAPQVVPRSARGATSRIEIHGTGRVREPIPGVTVPSPSDFGFSVDATGGYFLCSMFGPETGGFLGCQLMTVQGVVSPGASRSGAAPRSSPAGSTSSSSRTCSRRRRSPGSSPPPTTSP